MIQPYQPLQRAALLLIWALALGACSTPPPLRLHTLMPDLAPAAEAPGAPIAVQLGPVVVPAQVDQPQWLVRLPDGTLALLDNERWASPLRDEMRAALRDTLARRWGVLDAAGPGTTAPAWRIHLEVLRFESTPAREARIEAQWTVSALPAGPASRSQTCRAALRQPVGAGTVALADGHRRNAARLADRLGRQLRALHRGETPGCEADE